MTISSSTSASAFRGSPSRWSRTSWSGARPAGASTLTQQLARKLFLTDEKTWERKIREAILAIRIEKRYTKREIFTLYCNQMYFGHGVYGVEAASRLYFGKSAKDLELEEAAMIAGILQGNVRQSPYVNMDAAIRRRNYTLGTDGGGRLHHGGRSRGREEEADRHCAVSPRRHQSVAPYFLEEIRKELEQRYGAKQLYENGLSIQTALDVRLQEAVNRALDDGLRRIDKTRGWRKPRAQHRRRRAQDRDLPARAMGTADARRSGRPGGRHGGRWRGHHRARRRADGNDRPQGLRLDAQDVRRAARVTPAT